MKNIDPTLQLTDKAATYKTALIIRRDYLFDRLIQTRTATRQSIYITQSQRTCLHMERAAIFKQLRDMEDHPVIPRKKGYKIPAHLEQNLLRIPSIKAQPNENN